VPWSCDDDEDELVEKGLLGEEEEEEEEEDEEKGAVLALALAVAMGRNPL